MLLLRVEAGTTAETTDDTGRAVRTFGTAACPMVAVKEVLLMAWTVRGARPGIPLRRGGGTYDAGVLWPTASGAQTRRAEVDAALAAEACGWPPTPPRKRSSMLLSSAVRSQQQAC